MLRDSGTLIATVHFSQVVKRKYQLLCVPFDMVFIQYQLFIPLSGKEKNDQMVQLALEKINS